MEVEKLTINKITPEELTERLKGKEKVVLLDVRAVEKYKDFHIIDSQIESYNIPKTSIFNLEDEDSLSTLPKDREIIVTCTTGNSAAKCANILDGQGFKVKVLEGGITAWKEFKE